NSVINSSKASHSNGACSTGIADRLWVSPSGRASEAEDVRQSEMTALTSSINALQARQVSDRARKQADCHRFNEPSKKSLMSDSNRPHFIASYFYPLFLNLPSL